MSELDFLELIINRRFLQQGDDALTMIEPTDDSHKEQRVSISNRIKSISGMKLYCFNKEETSGENRFPFFNQNNNDPFKAPKELNSFCDYILLFQYNQVPYIFLLELKRGTKEGAEVQLNASREFVMFLLRTADRIKVCNDVDFDQRIFKIRRIIIKEQNSNKRITKPKNISPDELDNCLTCYCMNEFRPTMYL